MEHEELGVALVLDRLPVHVAYLEPEPGVRRHVGQEESGEEAHFVARPIEGVEAWVVLVGRHDGERGSCGPGGEVIEVATEPSKELVIPDHRRLEVADCGIGE